jgi:hypothetical protein
MVENALPAAREQLKYWQTELTNATDEQRKQQCKRFIDQCTTVIAALERGARYTPK